MAMIGSLKSFGAVCTVCGGVMILAGQACATDYAYMATGPGADNFGVIDLSTGVFSRCGTMSATLAGLGVGPDHQLYGGAWQGDGLYRVNVTNGALTLVGASGISFFLFGSTTTNLYAVGTDGNFYRINNATGAATLIGRLGVAISDSFTWGFSTNSKALYMTRDTTLYRIDTDTGAVHNIGSAASGKRGSEVFERHILYAGNFSPPSVDTLNLTNGHSTFLANISGSGAAGPWGLAPIKEQSISRKDTCKPHEIP
jgi:hypothetical protein